MVNEAAIAQATGVNLKVDRGEIQVVESSLDIIKLFKNGTILRPTVNPGEVPQPLNPLRIVTKPQRR